VVPPPRRCCGRPSCSRSARSPNTPEAAHPTPRGPQRGVGVWVWGDLTQRCVLNAFQWVSFSQNDRGPGSRVPPSRATLLARQIGGHKERERGNGGATHCLPRAAGWARHKVPIALWVAPRASRTSFGGSSTSRTSSCPASCSGTGGGCARPLARSALGTTLSLYIRTVPQYLFHSSILSHSIYEPKSTFIYQYNGIQLLWSRFTTVFLSSFQARRRGGAFFSPPKGRKRENILDF